MQKPQVKICGITNLIDAKNAFNLGANYIGFVNIDYSIRHISEEDIKAITKDLSDDERDRSVLLTDENSVDQIIAKLARLGTKILQPYYQLSNKDLSTLKSLGYKIFKPISVESEEDVEDIDSYRNYVNLIVLDTKAKAGEPLGGTGESFDWNVFNKAKKYTNIKLALAGGLNPENIEEAVIKTQPYMVDLSSGLESKPRIKSFDKMKSFFEKLDAIDFSTLELSS